MGLVHTVKPLKNMLNRTLRNPNTRVRHFNITILMVRIQRYMHPSVIFIVLDRIFHKIRQRKGHLHLVNLRRNRTEAFQYQLDITCCRNRTKPFQNLLNQHIHIL